MTKLTVEHFQVHEKIGEGAMSEIFLVQDNENQHHYALKVLKFHLSDQKDYTDRLLKEAKVLAQLKSEHIVHFQKMVTTNDGRLGIVQEYIKGKNVRQLLDQCEKQRLPLIGASLVAEVLLGLEDAHRQGIIHRDLKPENIMLTSEGQVKITDFGAAKELNTHELTQTGTLIGSPAYISPEQIKGETITPQSDVYALGVLLYRMATGHLPFQGSHYGQLATQILAGQYKPASKANEEIHPELNRIIDKALQLDRSQRYKNVYQFRADILSFLDSLQTDISYRVMARFFKMDMSDEHIPMDRLVETLMVRANDLFHREDKKESLSHLQQILKLNPEHQQANSLLKQFKLGKEKKVFTKKMALMASSLCVVVVGAGLYWQQIPVEKVEEKTDVVTVAQAAPIPVPVVETPPIKEKILKVQKVEKSEPKKIEPAKEAVAVVTKNIPTAKPTQLKFDVDDDVFVYLDNINVTAEVIKGAIELNPGRHYVRLQKPGFEPISSFVDVLPGETTHINARGSQK